jgi:hypothetical protein
MSISPRNFDPHAESIDGPARAWSDPEISRLDLMENRPWVREAVAKVRTSPTPYIALVSVIPDPPVVIRGHVPVLAWVGLALVLIVAGLLVLAAAVFS